MQPELDQQQLCNLSDLINDKILCLMIKCCVYQAFVAAIKVKPLRKWSFRKLLLLFNFAATVRFKGQKISLSQALSWSLEI